MLSNKDSMLTIGGKRQNGQTVRDENVMAVQTISNIIKSSLGPVGLDKMIVDNIGEVTISNDGATILSLLDTVHPTAKMLIELARQQDSEVGDGTTSVVIIASELLKKANELVKSMIHPTTIITGYRLALKEACMFIGEKMAIKASDLGKEGLISAAKTSLSSKVLGQGGLLTGNETEKFDQYFAKLAVDACLKVKTTVGKNTKCPIANITILKSHGKSQLESQIIDGYALNCTLASALMKKFVKDAKIACLDMNLQKLRMPMGVNIVVESPEQLEEIRQREIDITRERVNLILKSGANVILTTKGIDDMCIRMLIDSGAVGVRRCLKPDLERIAKATGATLISSFAGMDGKESFDASFLGTAGVVQQIHVSDNEMIQIIDPKKGGITSVILRGANEAMLDEMERSLHDSLCVIKRILESGHVVPGGGAVETAVSVYLENFSSTISSREQMAVAKFAEALLIIPQTLIVNAAKDSIELISALKAAHYYDQSHTKTKSPLNTNEVCYKNYGLDLFHGIIRDSVEAGVIEPALMKLKMLKSATEAAISILRIDDMISITPPRQQDPRGHC